MPGRRRPPRRWSSSLLGDGKTGQHAESLPGRPGTEMPAAQGDPFTHAGYAVAAIDPLGTSSAGAIPAGITALDLYLARPVTDAQVRRGRSGVANNVGKRLLGDPVGGQAFGEGQRAFLALDMEIDPHTCGGDLAHQERQVG